MSSIELNVSLHVFSTTGGTHSPTSFHYHGLAVDISRVNGRRFWEMTNEQAAVMSVQLAGSLGSFIPRNRLAEIIGPDISVRFYREHWPEVTAAQLRRAHRSHLHVSVLP
jgi:hypothetical protein